MGDEKSHSAGSSHHALPLEKAMIKFDGRGHPDAGKQIPALDVRWCDDKAVFPRFTPLSQNIKVYVRPWLRNSREIIGSCKWLLALPYHKFWSQVVYGDREFRAMIDTFLSASPRLYDGEALKITFFSPRNDKIKSVMRNLYEYIFAVLVRMATPRESSKCHFMSSEFHGRLIAEHGLFDIPRLMDMCSTYGHSNAPLVRRLLEIIFKNQPKLYDQLADAADTMNRALSKCEFDIERLVGRRVKMLRKYADRNDHRLAAEILGYMLDLTFSMCQFAKLWPKAMEYYHAAHLTNTIPKFVETTVGDMLQDLYDRDVRGGFRLQLSSSVARLGYIQSELVTLWRNIIQHNFLDKIKDIKPDSKDRALPYIDGVLNCLTQCVDEKNFLRLYARKYPLSNDLNAWITQGIVLDMERIEYISGVFTEAIDADIADPDVAAKSIKAASGLVSSLNGPRQITAATVAQFCELFPDYDPVQAEIILRHYDGNEDSAINAVLTGALPAECPQLPQEETTDDQKPRDEKLMVPLRESGKRGGKYVLEDKRTLASVRPFYDQYRDETEENEWDVLAGVKPLNAPLPQEDCDDEDEYDDTYDTHAVDVTPDNNNPAGPGHRGGEKQHQKEGAAGPLNYTGGRDRHNKERHKDHYANHNRKFFAMKKQSTGFFSR